MSMTTKSSGSQPCTSCLSRSEPDAFSEGRVVSAASFVFLEFGRPPAFLWRQDLLSVTLAAHIRRVSPECAPTHPPFLLAVL